MPEPLDKEAHILIYQEMITLYESTGQAMRAVKYHAMLQVVEDSMTTWSKVVRLADQRIMSIREIENYLKTGAPKQRKKNP